jgi:hypothetical protein
MVDKLTQEAHSRLSKTYSRPAIRTAVGTAAAVPSKEIDETSQSKEAGTADLFLVVVASRGTAAAATAGASHHLNRSGESSGGERQDGESRSELHFDLSVVTVDLLEMIMSCKSEEERNVGSDEKAEYGGQDQAWFIYTF